MLVRRRQTSFRPMLDTLPSRIAPTIYTPYDFVPMGEPDPTPLTGPIVPETQLMPTDADDVVGPSGSV